MENIVSDQRKFERATLMNDAFLNFAVNQEKHIDTIFNNLVDANSTSVRTRSSIMYGLCKIYKQEVSGCPPSPQLGQFY